MASVQILNSTLKNAQYAFRKAGLPCDKGYFLRQLREVFNDNPQICTKNGKFTKDGIFALKRMIEENGLNQASNWDDVAQILKARREAVRPIKQLAQKVVYEGPDKLQKNIVYKTLDLEKGFDKELLKYKGGTERYVKYMADKELANANITVDLTEIVKLLKEQTPGTSSYAKTRDTIAEAIDDLIKSGKKVEIPDKNLLSGLDESILCRLSKRFEITG